MPPVSRLAGSISSANRCSPSIGPAYPFVMAWIIPWVTDKTFGLRVSPDGQVVGLDLSERYWAEGCR
jgi:ammonia channel protein AmtB